MLDAEVVIWKVKSFQSFSQVLEYAFGERERMMEEA